MWEEMPLEVSLARRSQLEDMAARSRSYTDKVPIQVLGRFP